MHANRSGCGFFDFESAASGFEGWPIMRNKRRAHGALTLLVSVMALGSGSNSAQAQYGMGFGWGLGLMGMRQVPSPTDFVNQHALTRAAAGMQAPRSHSPYANNPNAYFNRIRDNGFVSHQDARRRRAPTYRQERLAASGNSGQAAARADAAAPRVPLGSFFDPSRRLVWPNDSPITGDLKDKRDVSDQASLAVLEETMRQTVASISSVTYARQKLLAYGQPALQEIRIQATSVIADSFHRFMLSLYDALAQSAGPEDAVSGTAPNP
jgi:hypothetical protein